jgi:hypothetical protein
VYSVEYDKFEILMKEAPAARVKVTSQYVSVEGETSLDFDDDDDEGYILSISFTFNTRPVCSTEQSLQLRYLCVKGV